MGGSMYIVNMVIVKLEANFGNIVDWKYKNRFETKKVDWKQSCNKAYICYFIFIYNLTCIEILDLIYIQRPCQTRLESSMERTGDLPVDSYSILILLNTSLYSKLLIRSFCFILVPPISPLPPFYRVF